MTVPQVKIDAESAEPNTLPTILPRLKEFIRDHMEHKVNMKPREHGPEYAPSAFNYADRDRNQLTLAVLDIYSSLLECGLFSSIPRVQSMVTVAAGLELGADLMLRVGEVAGCTVGWQN